MPSSMVTFLHHGVPAPRAPGPVPLVPNCMLSATSPTCLLSLTSRALLLLLVLLPDDHGRGLSRFARATMLSCIDLRDVDVEPCCDAPIVLNNSLPLLMSPCSHSSLEVGDCHWSGSEDDERRLRCRYTSVPYL